MQEPHLEVIQNDLSVVRGKCSWCDAYFTIFGPGLAKNPERGVEMLRRDFAEHLKKAHANESAKPGASMD